MPAKTIIQIRKGTSASWESSNPVLQQGEFIFIQDANHIKMGDGVSNYNALPGVAFDGGDLDAPNT